jgi:hypothetical protein
MITYEQIQAIHQAMRMCECFRDAVMVGERPMGVFLESRVDDCFAKIRAALAGETSTVSDAIAERDAKLSAALSIVQEMAVERDKLVDCGYPDDLTEFIDKLRDALNRDPFDRTTPGVSLYEAGREAFSDAGFIPPPLGGSGGINMTIPESTIDMGPGPIVEIDCERMVRPEDVAPPMTERSDEDSKITWQG